MYFEPIIWRRVQVPSDVLLPDLHKIIQTAMGWENAHLHQFITKDDEIYALPSDDDWTIVPVKDYQKVKLEDVLKDKKDSMIYEYDFGDSWNHLILLEKILPFDKKIRYPVCIDGEMNCPPEDCGGVWGYEEMLEVLEDPEDEEYEEYLEWLGEEFDPEYFDKDEVNYYLQSKDYGCIEF